MNMAKQMGLNPGALAGQGKMPDMGNMMKMLQGLGGGMGAPGGGGMPDMGQMMQMMQGMGGPGAGGAPGGGMPDMGQMM